MAQRKVRGRTVSLAGRGHLATRGRRSPLVPGEFERVVSPNGTRTLGVVRRMAGMLAFAGIAARESRAVAHPPAWAIDRHALAVASERGCDVVAILDADSNDTWMCALRQVKQVGVPIDRGSERQWAVPFECWTRLRDHTPVRASVKDRPVPPWISYGPAGRQCVAIEQIDADIQRRDATETLRSGAGAGAAVHEYDLVVIGSPGQRLQTDAQNLPFEDRLGLLVDEEWTCALGNAACRQGFSSRYYRVPRLLSDLRLAHTKGSYPRLLSRLAKAHLLILWVQRENLMSVCPAWRSLFCAKEEVS